MNYAHEQWPKHYTYLRGVFTELPNATSVEAIEALLPVLVENAKAAKVS